MRIETDAGAARRVVLADLAGRGHEGPRVLGVDAALDRMSAELDVVLRQPQRLAVGDADHLADQVDAGDHLGHRVLDLDAGVHLDEVELPVLVEKLEGAGAAVADALAGLDAERADLRALLGGDAGGQRLLDDLLVAPLHRAVALAEVDRVALAVGEHLDLHVPWGFQVLLHEHRAVAERRERLAARELDLVDQLAGFAHDVHTAAAATGRGLDQYRIADLRGGIDADLLVVRQHPLGAGDAGHAGGDHLGLRVGLGPHQPDRLRIGPDEDEARALHRFGEIRVLRQKAVTRMDRVGLRHLRSGDDRRHVQVAASGLRRADADGLVGEGDMLLLAVGGGIDRDGLDAQLAAAAQDAQRDLAAVGDEDFLDLFHRSQAGRRVTRSRTAAGRTPPDFRYRRGSRRRHRPCPTRSG